jgi:acyl carrier protein
MEHFGEGRMNVLEDLKNIIGDTLGLGDRARALGIDSGLLGEIPEFDSMAVVSVLTAIEEHFGVEVDDDEVNAETFETVGSLARFVASKLEA